MNDMDFPEIWSQRFGLARSPMFERHDPVLPDNHHVLLDGGYGSFGLSVADERFDSATVAGWAWSSDLPHHVTITKAEVQVVRWDDPNAPRPYQLDSVNRDLDGFYRYLCRDRLRSNRTVVQHLVNLFGSIRTLVAHANLPDERAIDAFVVVLADLIDESAAVADPKTFGLPDDSADLRAKIPKLNETIRLIRTAPGSLSALSLYPSLAIRHAGGQLFQEAHFDLVRAPPPDMFGFVEPARAIKRSSSGGIHFTPPALARSIVDYTLAQIDGVAGRRSLTICDPACGSGAFLHEALRGLRRAGFDGEVKILGRDISGPAIAMARFTLKVALRDWAPAGGAELDLAVQDSLEESAFPAADMIVMNPPFISIIAQTAEQKQQLRAVIGDKAASRGDYSMAFVTRALDAVRSGGVIGTLFPANLLTHEASSSWRENLASKADVRLLASFGDFGMFSQALVHVACIVIRKSDRPGFEFTALVADNESGATGDALRELRRTGGKPPPMPLSDRQWRLSAEDSKWLQGQKPWRMLTPRQRGMIDALEAAQTATVGKLFEILQGVQTGNLKVFLLADDDYRRLPSRERKYFREAIVTDSIRDGRIVKKYYLFFPHKKDGPLFEDESTLSLAVPTFYARVLKPNEQALRKRASIVRSGRRDWWGLMHPREFSFDTRPRIISKFFGAEGSFVLDLDGKYLPSTGHAWIPKLPTPLADSADEVDADRNALADVMRAYVAVLNSRIFIRLVSFRSVTVSGGQFDLSRRFIEGIFLPNLWERAQDPFINETVLRLARVTLDAEHGKRAISDEVEQLVARVYGVPQLGDA